MSDPQTIRPGATAHLATIDPVNPRQAAVADAPSGPQWTMWRQAPQPDTSLVRADSAVALTLANPRVLTATAPEPSVVRFIKRPGVAILSGLANLLRPLITAETQIKGGEWIPKLSPRQPMVWLVTHQTTLDFVNLFPLQRKIPGKPSFMIASRVLASKILSFVVKPFVFHLNRTSMGDGGGKHDAALQAANDSILARMRARFGWGGHVAIFPEGTTMTSGRIMKVKWRGFFSLIRVAQGDGTSKVIPTTPVGYTLDLLAGPRGRYLNFVNPGEPMVYEPSPQREGESSEAYEKREGEGFASKVHRRMLELSTVTASQLAGVYLSNKSTVSRDELLAFVHGKARDAAAAGYLVDEALLERKSCNKRFERLWKSLHREGYLQEGSAGQHLFDQERYGREKLNTKYEEHDPRRYKGYKQDNPLRYCANRLFQVMETDQRMRGIISA